MTHCLFCGRGPKNGVNLYRLNDKGDPGIWTCDEHLPRTDHVPSPDIRAIVKAINPRKATARP